MSGTAQGSPDGPKKIFGKENVNWQGAQKANDSSTVSGGLSAATSDFVGANTDYDEEEKRYYQYQDQLRGNLEDNFGGSLEDGYASFTEGSKRYDSLEDVLHEYASRRSNEDYDPEDTKDMMVSLDMCNVSENQLVNEANAAALGLRGEKNDFPKEWSVEDDVINIPLDFIMDKPDDAYLSDIAGDLQTVQEYLVLNEGIYEDMDQEARENAISEMDISITIDEMTQSDLEDYVYENGDFENQEDEDEFVSERIREYDERLNKSTIAATIDKMRSEGELDESDIEYYPQSKEYGMLWSDQVKVISKTLEDY